MSGLPIRRRQFKTAEFLSWLASSGAEIGTPTNPYEVCRYKAFSGKDQRASTHIVYAKDNELLTYCGATRAHYEAFMAGENIEFVARKRPRDKAPNRPGNMARARERLWERDGDECWYCGSPMGDDCTVEHLVNKSEGGGNRLENLALAHGDCNRRAGNLPLVEKIALRAQMRAEKMKS